MQDVVNCKINCVYTPQSHTKLSLSLSLLQTYVVPQISLFGEVAGNPDALFNNIRVYGTILLLLMAVIVFIGVKIVSSRRVFGPKHCFRFHTTPAHAINLRFIPIVVPSPGELVCQSVSGGCPDRRGLHICRSFKSCPQRKVSSILLLFRQVVRCPYFQGFNCGKNGKERCLRVILISGLREVFRCIAKLLTLHHALSQLPSLCTVDGVLLRSLGPDPFSCDSGDIARASDLLTSGDEANQTSSVCLSTLTVYICTVNQ